jgi:DNA-binding beta-propeller fold protein YncE
MRTTLPLPAVLTVAILLVSPAHGQAAHLELVAGGGTGGDGSPADRAQLIGPFGTAFDPSGRLYFVELSGQRVRTIDPDGLVRTVGGTGQKGERGDGGPAAKAEFNAMHSLAIARNGDIYVADTLNNRVRKIEPRTGQITGVAGTGRKGFSGDGGLATQAEFNGIYCIALDEEEGMLYLADLENRRIRAVDLKTSLVSTVAGNGSKGAPEDGATARAAPLVDPRAVAVDGRGNVYILERSGHALRVVDRSGKIRTVAGTGQKGSSGDGGPARQATMNGPKHLCVDPEGNVLIADTENHRIRMYRPVDATIVGVAGSGKKGTAGLGGPPADAELNQPHGVTIGPGGILYICDSSNHRILKIVP